jgi:hypothetical protein
LLELLRLTQWEFGPLVVLLIELVLVFQLGAQSLQEIDVLFTELELDSLLDQLGIEIIDVDCPLFHLLLLDKYLGLEVVAFLFQFVVDVEIWLDLLESLFQLDPCSVLVLKVILQVHYPFGVG